MYAKRLDLFKEIGKAFGNRFCPFDNTTRKGCKNRKRHNDAVVIVRGKRLGGGVECTALDDYLVFANVNQSTEFTKLDSHSPGAVTLFDGKSARIGTLH